MTFKRTTRRQHHNAAANVDNITQSAEARAREIEAYRAGLIMELIGLDIEVAAKDQILRLVRNYRRRA